MKIHPKLRQLQPGSLRLPVRRSRREAGFTLVEILTVAAIITFLVGITIAGLTKGTENGRASAVAGAISQIKGAVKQFADEHGGVVPITDSTTATAIPTSGTTLSGSTATVLSRAIILDTVLLTERTADRAVQLPAGPNPRPVNPTAADILWDPALQRFRMNPDAVPTRDYSLCNRLECQAVTATSPETALGSNFMLDGVNGLPAGRRVVAAIIPGCPASLALRISEKLDGERFSTNETTLDRQGAVVYNTPSNGVTDVYIYIVDL
ncbi:MAG: prepilin-type N-terminal cleavage/methylation domain-containing protein [Pirellulales bacterium]|nr:prepilin-type N-terminal cleavage/methylation domain-containing protein [Pirellulales bacterium]